MDIVVAYGWKAFRLCKNDSVIDEHFKTVWRHPVTKAISGHHSFRLALNRPPLSTIPHRTKFTLCLDNFISIPSLLNELHIVNGALLVSALLTFLLLWSYLYHFTSHSFFFSPNSLRMECDGCMLWECVANMKYNSWFRFLFFVSFKSWIRIGTMDAMLNNWPTKHFHCLNACFM